MNQPALAGSLRPQKAASGDRRKDRLLQPCCCLKAGLPRALATLPSHPWSQLGVTLLMVVVLEDDVIGQARLGSHVNCSMHTCVEDEVTCVHVAVKLGVWKTEGEEV